VPSSSDPMVAVRLYLDAFNNGDTKAMAAVCSDWVSPEIVEASFKLRPAGWQRFSRSRPEPATPPSCAVV
jgi:hypothetical protein